MLYLSERLQVRTASLLPSHDEGVQVREPELLASESLNEVVSSRLTHVDGGGGSSGGWVSV